MKTLILIITLLLITQQSFGLNPVDVDIKVIINKPPEIGGFQPEDGVMVNEGDTLEISVTATDPNKDELLYRFIINNVVKEDWSDKSSLSYKLQESDIGLNKIKAEVKDSLVTVQTNEVEIYVSRNTVTLPQT